MPILDIFRKRRDAQVAIAGMMAFRANLSFSDRPTFITDVGELDAWQMGWVAAYEASQQVDEQQAYLSYVSAQLYREPKNENQ